MTISRRALFFLAALLVLPACADNLSAPPGHDSIAGTYTLVTVDSLSLPFQGAPDSTGTIITITGGTLTLGDAAPRDFVATPAGWHPGSCVHQVPNGAHIVRIHGDTMLVQLPDGSSYKIPPCGDGPYTLVLTRHYEYGGGASEAVADTTSGFYCWGTAGDTEDKYITLVGTGLEGPVRLSPAGVDMRVTNQNFGRGPGSDDLKYEFAGPGD